MALDRALGKEERAGDLTVGVPGDSEPQDLALAMGEGLSLDAVSQHSGHDAEPCGDGAHRRRKGVLELMLENEGVGAGPYGAPKSQRAASRRDDHDPPGPTLEDLAQLPQRDRLREVYGHNPDFR